MADKPKKPDPMVEALIHFMRPNSPHQGEGFVVVDVKDSHISALAGDNGLVSSRRRLRNILKLCQGPRLNRLSRGRLRSEDCQINCKDHRRYHVDYWWYFDCYFDPWYFPN